MTPASLSQGSNHLLLTRFPNKTFQEYDPELFEVAHSFFLNDSTYFVEGGFYFFRVDRYVYQTKITIIAAHKKIQ